mgnify:CR=1 FL=1
MMDRPMEESKSWFEAVLRDAGFDPDRVAMVHSSRRPVVERSNPWEDHEGIDEAAEILEAAVGRGSDTGRILFVTEVHMDPASRVRAAVLFGRASVARCL